MKLLGFVVSARGISISPSKLEFIQAIERPLTSKTMMSFLGLVNYIRQHVRHFAELTAPFEEVRQEATIEWTPVMQEHFALLKRAIKDAVTINFPDLSKPLCIATDASNVGIGGVFYQAEDGELTKDNVIDMFSRKLSASQRNYSAHKKELYGVVQALTAFNVIIWGRHTTVFTDHKPITYIKEGKGEPSEAVCRWLDVLQRYDIEFRYREGILNVLPDALSRLYSDVYKKSPVWGIAPTQAFTEALARLRPQDLLASPPITEPGKLDLKRVDIPGFNTSPSTP